MARTLVGTVVSDKMLKTVVVSVERKFRHPKYKKVIIRNKRYKVDAPNGGVVTGDKVEIEETRPMSASKRFRITKKI